jgi:hypothetical protein
MGLWRRTERSARRRTSPCAVVLALGAIASLGLTPVATAQAPQPAPVRVDALHINALVDSVPVGQPITVRAWIYTKPLKGQTPLDPNAPIPGVIRVYAIETGALGTPAQEKPAPGAKWQQIGACTTRTCEVGGYVLDHPASVAFTASTTVRGFDNRSHRYVSARVRARFLGSTWTGVWQAYEDHYPKGAVTWQENGADVIGFYSWDGGGSFTAKKRENPMETSYIDGTWKPDDKNRAGGVFSAQLQGQLFVFNDLTSGRVWEGHCQIGPVLSAKGCSQNGR